jgi:hypothetical protein
MTEFTLVQLVPSNVTHAGQSHQWYIYANDLRLFEWTVAYPESRSVVYSRPAWEFAPFFDERAKLESTIDLDGVMQILWHLRIPKEQIKAFQYSLAHGGHTSKLLRWNRDNAIPQHTASS